MLSSDLSRQKVFDPMIVYPLGVDLPEQKLVFCCARRHMGDEFCAEVKNLAAGGLDWAVVLALARQHKLLCLLHFHLSGLCQALVPPEIKAELRQEFLFQSQRNLRLTGEILRLTRLMEARSIFPLAYKGPILSHLAYGDVALRPCVDLDLLVRHQDLKIAEEILEQNGYCAGRQFQNEKSDAPSVSNSARENWLQLLDYEHSFVNEKQRLLIELHWELAPRKCAFNLKTEDIWRQRAPSSLTSSIATLCPEDLLIALSNHGNRHVWKRLEWLANFSEIVAHQSETLDWRRVLIQARAQGTQRMLLVALLLAQDLGKPLSGHALPPFVLRAMQRDKTAVALRDQVWRQIFVSLPLPASAAETGFLRGFQADAEEMPSLSRVIFMTRIREKLRHRILYVTREVKTAYFLWVDSVLQEIQSKRVAQALIPGFFLLRFLGDAVVYAAFLLKISPKVESPEVRS